MHDGIEIRQRGWTWLVFYDGEEIGTIQRLADDTPSAVMHIARQMAAAVEREIVRMMRELDLPPLLTETAALARRARMDA